MPGSVGRRALALFLDNIIISIFQAPFSVGIAMFIPLLARQSGNPETFAMIAGGIQLVSMLFSFALVFFYYGWFYRNKGASPGKLLLGLKVVDSVTGTHIGYGRTVIRETVGKFFSVIIFFGGFIMAAFRSDRRALHDMIAGTQVIQK